MITVTSLLKIGEEFVPVEQWHGPLAEPDYVDGAIELVVDGVAILDQGVWDLVDFLWEGIVEALEALQARDAFDMPFPDQPLDLRFRRLPRGRLRLVLDLPGVARAVECALEEFVAAVVPAAASFFGHLMRLGGAHGPTDQAVLARLAGLAEHRWQ